MTQSAKAISFSDPSQEKVYNVSQNYGSQNYAVRAGSRAVQGDTINQSRNTDLSIRIDSEVANLLYWLAEQQGISPEVALKKAVITSAYIYDITDSHGGKLLVQHTDDSIHEIVLP